MSSSSSAPWWKYAVVYQIYPASFKDSNADGIGDLRGVISSLDHIKELGADTIWLSPMYESPHVDLGYDISNYEKVDPRFGSMQDVDELIEACHAQDLRIVLDLVVNHTSDRHEWFLESRSSRTNPKADWYHWHDGRIIAGERVPPNNWRSNFGGSAWEWDDERQQYYLHLFGKEMPDLNWQSMTARQAVYDSAMRFWLDKGIDGFRIDTMTIYSKPADYPDAPIVDPNSPWQPGASVYRNHPGVFEIHRDMYDKVWSHYGDLLLVGEYGNTSNTDIALEYCSKAARRVGMGFQFETVCLGYELCRFDVTPWRLPDFKAMFAKWQQFIHGTDGWTSAFLENHDLGRSTSRFGKSGDPNASAKMLAVLLATCTGTLFIYQGQEIGMTNIPDDWSIEEFKDINTQGYWASLIESHATPLELQSARKAIGSVARDHSRLPMSWSGETHAGFASPSAAPWMRVHSDYQRVNVAEQTARPDSVLAVWTKMLGLRRQHKDTFVTGSFRYVGEEDDAIMMYVKAFDDQIALVVVNWSEEEHRLNLPPDMRHLRLIISTSGLEHQPWLLRPLEARVYA